VSNLFLIFPRRQMFIWVLVPLLALAFGSEIQQNAGPSELERLVAVGDIHGDLDALVAILKQADVIEAQNHWIGRNVTLVQTGDYLDRGPKSRAVMDLLMALQDQAPKNGGRALILLGNHEMMNLVGDFGFLVPEDFISFADNESLMRQDMAYQSYREYRQQRAESLKRPQPQFTPRMEKRWKKTHPLGLVERQQAFGTEGKYGRWLRERPAIAEVDGVIFLHGGISPSLAGLKVKEINARVRHEIRKFDAYKQYFLDHKLILPFFNFEEITAAVQEELKTRKAEASQESTAAAKETKSYEPSEQEKKHLKILEDFLEQPKSWLSMHPDGPLWFRGFALWPDAEGAQHIARLLAGLDAKRFVVGHTVQDEGRIRARFGGKVFLIDTGMLSSYFPGGRASALEIQNDHMTAIYMDRRTVLKTN
jgi:hypothetical protein